MDPTIPPSLFMSSFPLKPSAALTIHKCQGLTLKDGVIIDFAGDLSIKDGLGFVALTRATSFNRVAFLNLKPYWAWLQMRDSHIHRCRTAWESTFDEIHDQTMAKVYGTGQWCADSEIQLHEQHGVINDTQKAELRARGVMAIPEQIITEPFHVLENFTCIST